ncbi:MAG: aminoglycoside phosphotransferase family protein [Clostridia bacterium]|nr:aminoglycoside phosphotransferase family protein [Clostridia bacterium]
MLKTLTEVGRRFRLPGEIIGYDVINTGNINSTIKVTYQMDGIEKKYVFQKINTYVFKNPEQIMQNIDKVTSYIRSVNEGMISLHFHHTDEGKNFALDSQGGFWRVMNCIDAITFDSCDDPAIIEGTGRAFGEFQVQLADFDGSVLYETIPDFHNTVKRLNTLFCHVEEDPMGRASEAKAEIEWLSSVRDKAGELWRHYENGEFPVRVTHNDTKCNNVLFDRETYLPLVVVDLDTVMPGMAMYDFGDAVRFIANTAEEDEPDLSKVSLDIGKFRAFCRGYVGAVGKTLSEAEIGFMALGTFSITVELASRFLDDYLTGDAYFRIKYPGHNLVRAKSQIQLAKDILGKMDALNKIVAEFAEAK